MSCTNALSVETSTILRDLGVGGHARQPRRVSCGRRGELAGCRCAVGSALCSWLPRVGRHLRSCPARRTARVDHLHDGVGGHRVAGARRHAVDALIVVAVQPPGRGRPQQVRQEDRSRHDYSFGRSRKWPDVGAGAGRPAGEASAPACRNLHFVLVAEEVVDGARRMRLVGRRARLLRRVDRLDQIGRDDDHQSVSRR